MKKLTLIAALSFFTVIFANDCSRYKYQIDSLMTEFNTVKDKMFNPGLTRDQYDDLNSIYTALWAEVVEAQKEQKKCNESKKSTVKVKVEPKKVNSALPSMLDLKWHSSRKAVKDQLKKRKDLKLVETDDGILEYRGGKFLNYSVEKWQFNFVDKKLYACQIVLNNIKGTGVFTLYEKISKDLFAKYGEPSFEKNRFPPSYKDDKIKISAIKNGSVSIYNKWLFNNDDVIRIGVNENGSVLITYLVDELYKKVK